MLQYTSNKVSSCRLYIFEPNKKNYIFIENIKNHIIKLILIWLDPCLEYNIKLAARISTTQLHLSITKNYIQYTHMYWLNTFLLIYSKVTSRGVFVRCEHVYFRFYTTIGGGVSRAARKHNVISIIMVRLKKKNWY